MQTHALHLGGKVDSPDDRDLPYVPGNTVPPASADLSHLVVQVYDQMPMQWACSANALAAIFEMLAKIEHRTIDDPSRLFFYYNARLRDGDASKDDGASIRDAIKAAADPGTCAEALWPYDQTKVLVKPPDDAYAKATEKIAAYYRMEQKLETMKACIAEGYPFLFGIQIFAQQFSDSQKSGNYAPPANGEQAVGGHAMVAVGYNANSFLALNSCGPSWGKNGYITIPNSYLTDATLTYDFWTIRSLK